MKKTAVGLVAIVAILGPPADSDRPQLKQAKTFLASK
jgi:hypothetical protein